MKELPDGPWQLLLKHAFTLIDEICKHGGIKQPIWTFGGGTVLMLRHNHRLSKFYAPRGKSISSHPQT